MFYKSKNQQLLLGLHSCFISTPCSNGPPQKGFFFSIFNFSFLFHTFQLSQVQSESNLLKIKTRRGKPALFYNNCNIENFLVSYDGVPKFLKHRKTKMGYKVSLFGPVLQNRHCIFRCDSIFQHLTLHSVGQSVGGWGIDSFRLWRQLSHPRSCQLGDVLREKIRDKVRKFPKQPSSQSWHFFCKKGLDEFSHIIPFFL